MNIRVLQSLIRQSLDVRLPPVTPPVKLKLIFDAKM